MSGSNIPASQLVNILPSVLAAGGRALDLSGFILTTNTRVPIGAAPIFSGSAAVAAFFGPTSQEATLANIYFLGFDGSTARPGALLFWQYNTAAVPAWLRGGSMGATTLTQLQALSGTLTITVGGATVSSGAINLGAATSFSNAAVIIAAAFPTFLGSVTFDSTANAFVFTVTATGATSTIGFASGSLSAGLNLTQANGATVSQGAALTDPTSAMNAIINVTQNWCCFMTTFEPATTAKLAFASWTNAQGNRYVYAEWGTDVLDTQSTGNAGTAAAQIIAAGYSGIALHYCAPAVDSIGQLAAFYMGSVASFDFTRRNGRTTMAARTQSGLAPQVTNGTVQANLIANGLNLYGVYGTANSLFNWYEPGAISGPFKWTDSYICQVWMNNQFQLSLMQLLAAIGSIPYNAAGYMLIEESCSDVIQQALTFGAIRAGVTLSQAQIAAVNFAAGLDIASTIGTRGWYLQILDALPQVRAARTSPPMSFWYTDGGSIHKLSLASIEIQ